jgi:hypothetical protein
MGIQTLLKRIEQAEKALLAQSIFSPCRGHFTLAAISSSHGKQKNGGSFSGKQMQSAVHPPTFRNEKEY